MLHSSSLALWRWLARGFRRPRGGVFFLRPLRARFDRQASAATVVEIVNHGRQKVAAPAHERLARELAKLDPKDQPKAWAVSW